MTICGALAPSGGESATVHIKNVRPVGPIRGQPEKSVNTDVCCKNQTNADEAVPAGQSEEEKATSTIFNTPKPAGVMN